MPTEGGNLLPAFFSLHFPFLSFLSFYFVIGTNPGLHNIDILPLHESRRSFWQASFPQSSLSRAFGGVGGSEVQPRWYKMGKHMVDDWRGSTGGFRYRR